MDGSNSNPCESNDQDQENECAPSINPGDQTETISETESPTFRVMNLNNPPLIFPQIQIPSAEIQSQMQANLEPHWWYLDSGATDHVTKYLVNFSSFFPCNGRQVVRLANGSSLQIEHTGSSHLIFGNRCCILRKLLHVPDMTKNFLSVSQFTKDNDIFFEFHALSCYIKDRQSGEIISVGEMFGGLYRIQVRWSYILPFPYSFIHTDV